MTDSLREYASNGAATVRERCFGLSIARTSMTNFLVSPGRAEETPMANVESTTDSLREYASNGAATVRERCFGLSIAGPA
jgi:hypothetical protein